MEKLNLIKTITEAAKKHGLDIRIRDIAYGLLRVRFDDALTAYAVVFGMSSDEETIKNYESLDSVEYAVQWFTDEQEYISRDSKENDLLALIDNAGGDVDSDLTFEENKAAMIELIKRTEEALAAGLIETEKALKIIADLRVKLNDKFGANEKSKEQRIIVVPPKNNMICPHTRKECWEMTEEYAKQKFHLIKDPNYHG